MPARSSSTSAPSCSRRRRSIPTQPLDPDTARDGEIFNIWTLDLVNGELRQLTDTATGNVNPVRLAPDEDGGAGSDSGSSATSSPSTACTRLELQDPLYTAATSDFGGPGPIIDFQSPLTHTLNPGNVRRKGPLREHVHGGAGPRVNFGVTNSGDLLGGDRDHVRRRCSADQLLSLQAYSIDTYRTFGGTYANRSGRLQFALQGFSTEQFFYGLYPGAFYGGFGFLRRDDAIATRRMRGGNVFGIYPFDRFRRVELSAGVFNSRESFNDPNLRAQSESFQIREFGTTLFQDGTYMPLGVRYVQETTVLREFGPVSGNTVMFGYTYAPGAGGLLSRQTLDVDARYYMRLAESGVLAFRARAFRSWGEFPDFTFFGGNSEMRGYDYLEFLGHKSIYANAELRFPLIEAMLTPIGVLGGIRGTFFFNFGVAGLAGQPLRIWNRDPVTVRPVVDYVGDPDTQSGPGRVRRFR